MSEVYPRCPEEQDHLDDGAELDDLVVGYLLPTRVQLADGAVVEIELQSLFAPRPFICTYCQQTFDEEDASLRPGLSQD